MRGVNRVSEWTRLAPAIAVCLVLGCVTLDIDRDPPVIPIAEAKRNVGIDHLARARTAMAIRELRQAEELDPKDHVTKLWLGEAYRRKGRMEEAERYMLEALELNPQFHPIRVNLTALYIQLERYEDSIRHSQILFDDPTFPAPWRVLVNRGWAEYKLGRIREARASFLEALDFHPTYWPSHLNLGILENAQGRKLAAIERFQKVLDKKPGRAAEAEVNYRIGEILVALGRRDRAIRHFSRAVEDSPYARWGKQSEEYLKLLR